MYNGAGHQEVGAQGAAARAVVHWRSGSVPEGSTLQRLRNQTTYSGGLGTGLCFSTKGGNCLHKRKCGNMQVGGITVYAYRDHEDLQALRAAKRCSICESCERFFTAERFLLGTGQEPHSTAAARPPTRTLEPAPHPQKERALPAIADRAGDDDDADDDANNSWDQGDGGSTFTAEAAGQLSLPPEGPTPAARTVPVSRVGELRQLILHNNRQQPPADPQVGQLRREVERLKAKVGQVTQQKDGALAEAAAARSAQGQAKEQQQQQRQEMLQLQGQAAAEKAAAQALAEQQQQLLDELRGEAAAARASAHELAERQQQEIVQLQGILADAERNSIAAQVQAERQQQLIAQLQGQVAETSAERVAALQQVERLTRRRWWHALKAPCMGQ